VSNDGSVRGTSVVGIALVIAGAVLAFRRETLSPRRG
jgi:hypothetical protein